MPIVTLTSDWNLADFYIGAVKGRILSNCPEAVVVDINHQIEPFNILQAVYVIKNAYKNFPKGSIHIVAVDSEANNKRKHIAVKYDEHYFIGVDNGFFYLLTEGQIEKIIELQEETVSGFPELDMYSDISCKIIKNEGIDKLGVPRNDVMRQLPMLPVYEDDYISGKVIYIDSYFNIVTNITKELFEEIGKSRNFEIFVQSKQNVIKKLNSKYNETEEGELLALFNTAGLLEIAINKGKAARLLSLDTKSEIKIVFENKTKNDSSNSKNDLQGKLF